MCASPKMRGTKESLDKNRRSLHKRSRTVQVPCTGEGRGGRQGKKSPPSLDTRCQHKLGRGETVQAGHGAAQPASARRSRGMHTPGMQKGWRGLCVGQETWAVFCGKKGRCYLVTREEDTQC